MIYSEIIYYTDGSLGEEGMENHIAGYGLIQLDSKGAIVRELKGRIQGWFSSTRSELIAILVAMLISPNNSKVDIFTDSQAAIQAIKKSQKTESIRSWCKAKNPSILGTIVKILKTKNIILQLHKVKAHTGNILNDLADKAAKKGSQEEEITLLAANEIQKIIFKPTWNMQIIDTPIRSFVKTILQTFHKADWLFTSNQKDNIHQRRTDNQD